MVNKNKVIAFIVISIVVVIILAAIICAAVDINDSLQQMEQDNFRVWHSY